MSSTSLSRSAGWSLTGNVVFACCQWTIFVVLAKFGTAAMIGQYALGLAIVGPVILFSNLQVKAIVATDAARRYRFSDYLTLRLLTTAVGLAVITGIVVAGGLEPAAAHVVLAVGLLKAVESVSDITYGRSQQHERLDRVAQSLMLRGVLALVGFSAGLLATGTVIGATVGSTVAWLTVLMLFDLRGQGTLDTPRWRVLGKLVNLGLPLGFVMLLGSLNANVPRYLVEHFFGAHELGIFSAIAALLVAEWMVVNAVGQSVVPRLARYRADADDRGFRRLVAGMIGVGTVVAIAGLAVASVAGRPILRVLYTEEYTGHVAVLVWLMIAAIPANLMSACGFAATASGRIRLQPLALAAACLTTTLTGLWLVPQRGLVGAAIAVCIGFVAGVIGFAILLAIPSRPHEAAR